MRGQSIWGKEQWMEEGEIDDVMSDGLSARGFFCEWTKGGELCHLDLLVSKGPSSPRTIALIAL